MRQFFQGSILAVSLILLPDLAHARLCDTVKGTVQSADQQNAVIVSEKKNKSLYKIDMTELSEADRQSILKSVGQPLEICIPREYFSHQLPPAKKKN